MRLTETAERHASLAQIEFGIPGSSRVSFFTTEVRPVLLELAAKGLLHHWWLEPHGLPKDRNSLYTFYLSAIPRDAASGRGISRAYESLSEALKKLDGRISPAQVLTIEYLRTRYGGDSGIELQWRFSELDTLFCLELLSQTPAPDLEWEQRMGMFSLFFFFKVFRIPTKERLRYMDIWIRNMTDASEGHAAQAKRFSSEAEEMLRTDPSIPQVLALLSQGALGSQSEVYEKYSEPLSEIAREFDRLSLVSSPGAAGNANRNYRDLAIWRNHIHQHHFRLGLRNSQQIQLMTLASTYYAGLR